MFSITSWKDVTFEYWGKIGIAKHNYDSSKIKSAVKDEGIMSMYQNFLKLPKA